MPIDSAITGCSPIAVNTGTNTAVATMNTTLNIVDDIEGMKNLRSALSMPISAAATAMSMRNGMLTRVNAIVSSSLPGESAYSSATNLVIGSAKIIPRTTSAPVTTSNPLMTWDP